jgi:hypothetical protein
MGVSGTPYDIEPFGDGTFFASFPNSYNGRISADASVGLSGNINWTVASLPEVATDATPPIAYGTVPSGTVIATTDGGVTWSTSATGFGAATTTTLTASRSVSGHVWAGTNHGIFRSTDTGATFVPASSGFPDLEVVSLTSDAVGRLYASGADANVYRSVDGDNWSRRNTVSFCTDIQDLETHPYRIDMLWAATSCGAFVSTDGGTSWSGFGFGFGDRFVNRLAVGSNGTVLHAGLIGAGVWERSLVAPAGLYTLTSCRLVDTRNPTGPLGGPSLTAGRTRNFALAGACGVPTDARSVAVNVTVVNPSAGGYLRIFPGDEVAPHASTINFRAGITRANNAALSLSTDGAASVNVEADLASGTVDFVLDVAGFYR